MKGRLLIPGRSHIWPEGDADPHEEGAAFLEHARHHSSAPFPLGYVPPEGGLQRPPVTIATAFLNRGSA